MRPTHDEACVVCTCVRLPVEVCDNIACVCVRACAGSSGLLLM